MTPTYDALVAGLEHVESKETSILALRSVGEAAKPALLRGLEHPAWRVRHGCLLVLDHTIIDDATRLAVLRAVDDPHRKVRRAAHHVLGCEACKPAGFCGVEGVDLEALALNTAMHDPSRSVRLPAMVAFMWRPSLDDRVADAMRHVIASEVDDELRGRAARVLAFPAVASMPKGEDRRAKFADLVQQLLA